MTDEPKPVRIQRRKYTSGERLLRNTAIACAMLLGLLSMKYIDAPWARRASETVEKALTARIDLDETLGGLSFVRRIMPESAYVFWNMNTGRTWSKPVAGRLVHAYSEDQPYYLFHAVQGDRMSACEAGTVTRQAKNEDGEWVIEVTHEDGGSIVYAYLQSLAVKQGESVEAGAELGICGAQNAAYVEYRRDGQPLRIEGFEK